MGHSAGPCVNPVRASNLFNDFDLYVCGFVGFAINVYLKSHKC